MQQIFLKSLISVAIMLAYAVPGFIFIKTKFLKIGHVEAFNKFLLYVLQPFLTLYAFKGATYTKELGIEMVEFFFFTLAFQLLIIVLFYLIFRKKYDNVLYRISNIAIIFGNVGFFGIPLLESVLPKEMTGQAVMFSCMFLLSMNMTGWSLGSTIITRDKKHINLKKMFLNPAVLPIIIAIPMLMTNTEYQPDINNMINVLAKASAPVCMMILGMRLATVELKSLFTSLRQYLTVIFKQVCLPLIGTAIIYFMPVSETLKVCLFILCCCPVASIVLNFSELHGDGQKTAANMMLLSTLSCIFTIPLMAMLLPQLYPATISF